MDVFKKVIVMPIVCAFFPFPCVSYARTVQQGSTFPPHSSSVTDAQIEKYILFMRELNSLYKQDHLYSQMKDAQGNSEKIKKTTKKLTLLINNTMKKQDISSNEIDLAGREIIANKRLADVVKKQIEEE